MSSIIDQKTESSAVFMRRRNAWEAADSGVLLWRSNFFYFIPFFAIPVWAVACGLRLLPNNLTWLSYLLLWWLKPLFDRAILHVVSLRFFDSSTSHLFRDLRRGLAGTMFRFLPGDLLWRRFSPGRGSRMPVRLLERLNGKQFNQRKKTLAYGGLNFCYFITVFGLALEAALLFGEATFVFMAASVFNPSALGYMRDNMQLMEVFIFAGFCLNYILVESLYVCMGFALYINSRIEVEGWDLQILFQKFAKEEKPKQGIKTAVILCLLFITMLAPARLSAEENAGAALGESAEEAVQEVIPIEYFPPDFSFVPEESLNGLKEILDSRDFGYEKEGWKIKYKYSKETKKTPDIELPLLMEKLRRIFGIMLRFIVILVIASSAAFVFYWFRKFYREGRFRSFGKNAGLSMYQNPLLSPENPESLFAKAEDLFRKGLQKEAWAACISGCLGAYTEYHSIFFPAGATEYGCLSLVREAMPSVPALSVTGLEAEDCFGNLVRNWINLVYGGRFPRAGAFEEALAFGKSIKTLRSGSEASPGGSSEP